MNFYKIIFSIVVFCQSVMINTYAANMQSDIACNFHESSKYIASHFVTTFSVGPVWGKGGNTQTLELTPSVIRTYDPQNTVKTIAYGELFVGAYQNVPTNFQYQLGLAVAASSKTKLSGEIWEDATPLFNNYKYDYIIQHSHLALKGKLVLDKLDKKYLVIPWVAGSAGMGFNRVRFDNAPTIDGAVATRDFKKNLTTAFTYTLSAGLLHKINQNHKIGIGYEFADWGKSELKPSLGQTTSQVLSLRHFYTHGVLLHFSYLV